MTITISVKEPASQVTEVVGLKEALASLIEQHDLSVDRIDIQEVES